MRTKKKKNKHQTNPQEEDKDIFLQTELINILGNVSLSWERGKRCGKADVNERREKKNQPDGERRVSPHSSPGSSLEVRPLGFCCVFSPSKLSDGHFLTPGDPPKTETSSFLKKKKKHYALWYKTASCCRSKSTVKFMSFFGFSRCKQNI